MEKLAFVVDRLNSPPFNKGFTTMSEFDGKSSLDLLDLLSEVIANIDPEQEGILKEDTEYRIQRILNFLRLMKFTNEDQFEDVKNLMMTGDKEMLQTVMHWCLQRYDHLKKRAYLAKYLSPEPVPPEFMGDELIIELQSRLKQLQTDFKDIHKRLDQLRSSSAKPGEIKAEIARLEQERTQLQNKIQRMKKDAHHDDQYFQDMLKVPMCCTPSLSADALL